MAPKKVLLLALILVVLMLSACQINRDPSNGYEEVILKMNYAQVTSYAPIIIAEAEGYFAEYGIKIEKITFNSSVEAVPLVVSGDLDVYAGATTAGILNVLGQDDNIKVVADRGHIEPDGCTFHAVVVRKDLVDSGEITRGSDLAGHSVSTPETGPGIFFLSHYLEDEGLTLDDVTISAVPSSSYIDAFRNKGVDAIIATELHLSRLLADGNAVVMTGSEDVVGYTQTSLLAFGKNLLKEHPEVGVRFMAAYLKGVAQYNQGKTERNLQIMAEATGEPIDLLENSCWLAINSDGRIDFSIVDQFQTWSVAMGHMEKPITEEQFWDPSFLEAAIEMIESE